MKTTTGAVAIEITWEEIATTPDRALRRLLTLRYETAQRRMSRAHCGHLRMEMHACAEAEAYRIEASATEYYAETLHARTAQWALDRAAERWQQQVAAA